MFSRKPKPADRAAAHTSGARRGLMQDRPVNLVSALRHAATIHRRQSIVTASPTGDRHSQTYAETYDRAQQLAGALKRLGVRPGDRVGTMGWNTHQHLEAWYAISGQGAICHTLNPRLPVEQLAYIMAHAEDSVLLVDAMFAPLLAALRPQLPALKHVIVLADRSGMPDAASAGGELLCSEELIAAEDPAFDWPSFPEETASSLCYTSGTTGDPKGVLYSHRSNLLMAYAITSRDVLNIGAGDAFLVIVPMFHANAWGLVYGGPMTGAKLILPGAALDGASVLRLIKEEQVTQSAAVPTVWTMLLSHLEASGGDLAPLKEVIIGGAAPPRAMLQAMREKYGVLAMQGWGMTETSPVGAVNRPTREHLRLPLERQLDQAMKSGRPLFGIELKIVDEDGEELPWDGATSGRLLARGPWVANAYYGRDAPIIDADGWFDTGDVATIDDEGYMQITDRAKDVIKSGGEWISSVDLENAAMGAPGVELACAVGVPHAKWGERPILLVVPKPGAASDADAIRAHCAKTFAAWQLPDAIIFVETLPMTATGKFDKKVLRVEYAGRLSGAPA